MGSHEAKYINVPVLGQMEQHYVKVWGILMVLFIVSVLGPEAVTILGLQGTMTGLAIVLFTAFFIAVIKAGFVIRDFMHVNQEPPIVWYILTVSLGFMGLFVAGVSPDVMAHSGQRWVNQASIDYIEARQAAGPVDHHGEGHEAAGHEAEGHEAPAHEAEGH